MTTQAASYRSSMLLSSTRTGCHPPPALHIGPNMMAGHHDLRCGRSGRVNYNVGRVANDGGTSGMGGLRTSRFESGHQAKNVLNVTVLLKRAVVNWIGRPAPGPWDSQRGYLRGEPTDPKGGNDAGWGVLTTKPT
jgi:hypothetical protein